MSFVLELPSLLQEAFLREKPSISDVVLIVATTAVFWAAFIGMGSRIIGPLVRNKPWLVEAAKRDYKISGKKLQEDIGDPKTEEEFVAQFERLWPWFQLIFFQHFVGGLLCAPSVLNLTSIASTATAARLACLGVLSEVGWEVEDTIGWLYKRYLTKDGYQTTAFAFIVILLIHHSLATFIGVPMVMLHGDSKLLHWLCFDLQLAAAIGGFTAEYTKILDVSKPNQLLQFQVLSFVALAVMVLTRGLHWFYLCYQLLSILVAEGKWVFFVFGLLVAAAFTAFNWVLCIVPFYKRFIKFFNYSIKHQNLPSGATPSERRQSIYQLEDAAAELFKEQDLSKDLLSLFTSPTEMTRRATLPPSFYQSKRPSFLLGGSSTRHFAAALASMRSERHLKTE